MERKHIIEKMFNYLSEGHKNNIHKEAFCDISNVFLEMVEQYRKQWEQYKKSKSGEDIEQSQKIQWVCNASMGHGKTTVLTCFLKWLVSEKDPYRRIPVLLVIRENEMARQIFEELDNFKKGCIAIVNHKNKQEVEPYVPYHQIVIITHSRLDNLTLGYGNGQIYKVWEQYRTDGWTTYDKLDEKNFVCKRHRLLIIDEKPSFVNASVFGIDDNDNVLKWFNDLAEPLGLNVYESQMYKSHITTLVARQLAENQSSVTTSLIDENDNSIHTKKLKEIITKMKSHEDNKSKNESLKQIKHFEKLLKKDEAGRIDDYQIRKKVGRKIIVSERIDYSKLGMNILVLDGTAELTFQQYKGFKFKKVQNYNDYSRLHFHVENINTSKYSRSKTGNPTQKAIAKRIMELKDTYSDIFVLPTKSDIPIYINLNAINKEDLKFFEEKSNEATKPINLLNTTGKNELKDRKVLYLTSLPKMNADHYKKIAIAFYGNNVDISMSSDRMNDDWFNDSKLQSIYEGELYAEILQIIHRTALRKITSNDEIHIFIAYDDEDIDKLMKKPNGATMSILSKTLNRRYFKEQAHIHTYRVQDESLYKRGETIRDFAQQIHRWIEMNVTFYNDLPKPISHIDKGKNGIGEKFRNWLKRHWNDKKEMINAIFAEYGYIIYEQKDEHSEKTKYIDRIDNYKEREMIEILESLK